MRFERRDVVEGDDCARASLHRAKLVEDPVLRHLEEPGREPAPQRELRQALIDAEEDLLRQVLGECAVADKTQDVVVNRSLVGADDQVERAFVAALSFLENSKVGLGERHRRLSISRLLGTRYQVFACHL